MARPFEISEPSGGVVRAGVLRSGEVGLDLHRRVVAGEFDS